MKLIPIGPHDNAEQAQTTTSDCDLVCNITNNEGERGMYTGTSQDSLPYSLNFVVSNEGSTQYLLNPLTGKITSTNCHFYISFGDNPVLQMDDPYPCTSDPNWSYISYEYGTSGLVGTLCLGWVGSDPLPLDPGQVNSLKVAILYYSTADPGETIELTVYTGATSTFTPPVSCPDGIDFSAQLLSPTPQLLCELVGPDTILNDGATGNSFVIKLYNPTDLAVTLAPEAEIVKITLDTVENVGDTGSRGALTTTLEAAHISASLDPSVEDRLSIDDTGATGDNNLTVSWTLRTLLSTPIAILPNSKLEITFSQIKTSLQPGLSNVTVQYLNVVGLENQVHGVSVLKTPFIFHETTVAGNGLGSSNSDLPSGVSLVYKDSSTTTPTDVGALFQFNTENVGLVVQQKNSAQKSARLTGGKGVLIDNVPSDYGLTIDTSKGGKGLYIGDPAVIDSSSEALLYVNGGAVINTGNLEIKTHLQVDQTATITGNLTASSQINATGDITTSGRVTASSGFIKGEGGLYVTTNPNETYSDKSASLYVDGKTIVDNGDLQVNGDLNVTGNLTVSGNITVLSGTVTFGQDSVVMLKSQASPTADKLELVVLDTSGGKANFRCHDLYNEGWIYLGQSADVALSRTTSGTGSGVALNVGCIGGSCSNANVVTQDLWAEGGVYIGATDKSNYSELHYKNSPTDSKGGGLYLSNFYSNSLNSDWAQGTVDTQSGTD